MPPSPQSAIQKCLVQFEKFRFRKVRKGWKVQNFKFQKFAKIQKIKISKFRFLQNGMVDLKVMHIDFQKDRMKTVGGIPPDGQTDRRTDGRKKRSLYAPPFSMGGITNRQTVEYLKRSDLEIALLNFLTLPIKQRKKLTQILAVVNIQGYGKQYPTDHHWKQICKQYNKNLGQIDLHIQPGWILKLLGKLFRVTTSNCSWQTPLKSLTTSDRFSE